MNPISAPELKKFLESHAPLQLVHVLPEEAFAARRIKGSLNACVYETAFISRMNELVPDQKAAVAVYGQGAPSLDSDAALRKLEAAGYENVTDFRGGLQEWIADGFPIEGDGIMPTSPQPDGTFRINPATSTVHWTGRNLFNAHYGTVKLAEGHLMIEHGKLRSASFTLDMNSIANDDLADPQWNAMLVAHLRSDDFFATEHHPSAVFATNQAEPLPGATEGTPNYLLHGTLTLRGVTKPLVITAVIAAADADHLTGQAQFEIDRTEFGSFYGSGKWFAFLGKHVVNDHFHLHVKINAERADS